jgi:hypothetical protein
MTYHHLVDRSSSHSSKGSILRSQSATGRGSASLLVASYFCSLIEVHHVTLLLLTLSSFSHVLPYYECSVITAAKRLQRGFFSSEHPELKKKKISSQLTLSSSQLTLHHNEQLQLFYGTDTTQAWSSTLIETGTS